MNRHVSLKKLLFPMMALALSAFASSPAKATSGWDMFHAAHGPLSGPANYHATYDAINEVKVHVKGVMNLRLDDGSVISVPMQPQVIDLMKLDGFGKGIPLSLANVKTPNNATELDVVEIELLLYKHGQSEMLSTGAQSCKLRVPHRLNLFTRAPITVRKDTDYLIKVDFSALDAIQLDIVGGKSQAPSPSAGHRNPKIYPGNGVACVNGKVFAGHGRAIILDGNEDLDAETEELIKTYCQGGGQPHQKVMKCALVNKRHAIKDIVDRANEF